MYHFSTDGMIKQSHRAPKKKKESKSRDGEICSKKRESKEQKRVCKSEEKRTEAIFIDGRPLGTENDILNSKSLLISIVIVVLFPPMEARTVTVPFGMNCVSSMWTEPRSGITIASGRVVSMFNNCRVRVRRMNSRINNRAETGRFEMRGMKFPLESKFGCSTTFSRSGPSAISSAGTVSLRHSLPSFQSQHFEFVEDDLPSAIDAAEFCTSEEEDRRSREAAEMVESSPPSAIPEQSTIVISNVPRRNNALSLQCEPIIIRRMTGIRSNILLDTTPNTNAGYGSHHRGRRRELHRHRDRDRDRERDGLFFSDAKAET